MKFILKMFSKSLFGKYFLKVFFFFKRLLPMEGSKYFHIISFFRLGWSFSNAWLFAYGVCLLIMGAANMPLMPMAVATTVGVLHCLVMKHCLYPAKVEDKSKDLVTLLARKEDNQLCGEDAVVMSISDKSTEEILVANNANTENTITVTINNSTENSPATAATVEAPMVANQPVVDYVYHSSFGKKAPMDSFNIPYDTWEGGDKLMYKDLPLFVNQYKFLPRRGILDITLSQEDTVYFNNKLTPIMNCFFVQEQPFTQPEFVEKWEKLLVSSKDPAVTPAAFSKLKLAFWDDVITTYVVPYTHSNLYRLYDELDNWDFDSYLKFVFWVESGECFYSNLHYWELDIILSKSFQTHHPVVYFNDLEDFVDAAD